MTVSLICALLVSRTLEWQVNSNNTLIWEGKPYLPVGLSIQGNVGEIDRAAADGISDVVISLPADGRNWSECFKALNDRQMRFFVSISSMPPMRDTVIVDPAGYRIPELSRKTNIDLAIPEASEALLVLVAQRDSTVRWFKRVPVVDGHIRESIDPLVELPHVLLAFPIVRSAETTDFYDGLDDHRDRLLSAFQRVRQDLATGG